MRRVDKPVPLEICKQRVLDYLRKNPEPQRPSSLGYAIWPEATFYAQGAAAAASRILKRMQGEGTIYYKIDGRTLGGWVINKAARIVTEKEG